jgi:multidrug transporter EmrE-like cation transporter
MKYLILVVYAAISSYGLYKLKAEELLSLPFIIGFGFYGLGMLIWLGILRTTPISVAFPVAAGSLIIATQLIGSMAFSERIGVVHVLGISLIFSGIVVIYAFADGN